MNGAPLSAADPGPPPPAPDEPAAAPSAFEDLAALAAQLSGTPYAGLWLAGPGPGRFAALHGGPTAAERASLAAFAEETARAGAAGADAGDGEALGFRKCAPVRDASGAVIGAVCVGDSVSRRPGPAQHEGLARLARQASALAAAEADAADPGAADPGTAPPGLREIADPLPLIVWTAAADGAVDYVSAAFARLTGGAADHWIDAVRAEDRAAVAADWDAAVAAGTPFEAECRLAVAEGGHRWHLVAARPERDAAGRPARWFGSVVDVHARREAEEELRANEGRLRAVIETEPECVKIVSADGTLLEMNSAGLRMVQATSSAQVVGRAVEGLIHPEDRETFAALHARALAGGTAEASFRVVGLDGGVLWMDSRAAPLRGADGAIEAVLSVTRDATAQRRESRLRQIETEILGAILDGEPLSGVLRTLERRIEELIPNGSVAISVDGEATAPKTDAAETWATLVHDGRGEAVARIALRCDASCGCSPPEREVLERLKAYAGLAIERSRQSARMKASEEHYRAMFDLVPVLIWEEDWSEVREALAALRRSEVRDYAAWLDARPDFVESLIRKVRVLDVNRAAARMFAAESPVALMAAHGRIVETEGALRTFRKALVAYLEGRREFETENATVDLQGRRLDIFVRMSLPDFDSDDARVILSEMDITALKVATDRLSVVVNATSDVVWDEDLITGEIWCSEGMRTLFGVDPEALASHAIRWNDLVHPDERAMVAERKRANNENDAEAWSNAYRVRRADGAYAHVVDRGRILRDADGRAVRLIGAIEDVTQQVKVEEQLRQSQRLESIGRLTGGVAHDFNNLLTVILGAAETLCERLESDPEARRLAEMCATAAERGSTLTRRLLAFARKQPLEPRRSDVGRLLLGMRELLRRTLAEQIELEVSAEPGLAAELDPGQLEVALLNLAINARDAMPDGGRLTLTARATTLAAGELESEEGAALPEGEYVAISVADDGAGMSPDVVRRAFEPFFTTKEVGKGSGLGLSLVYGFVRQSRGHVSIRSEPGAGTTVRMLFPRARGAAAAEPAAKAAPAPQGAAEHVLVVEDDAMVRDQLVAQLAALGYRVTSAPDGPTALEILGGGAEADLLLTDVVMPGGVNGRQLADLVRTLRPGLKVLFTSGHSQDALARDGRLDPSIHLLAKPYRRRELAAKLRQVLDG